MTLEGAMGEAMAFEGSTKAFVFEAYVERFLAPTLRPGQIMVMDNHSARKTERVRQLIEARGAELWFLLAYSPDLNPIEEAFSKVKALLKKAPPRTREALVEAVRRALSAVSPEDAKGWFFHCGYEAEAQGS
jgi:transposase